MMHSTLHNQPSSILHFTYIESTMVYLSGVKEI